jgi:hypothetical protein
MPEDRVPIPDHRHTRAEGEPGLRPHDTGAFGSHDGYPEHAHDWQGTPVGKLVMVEPNPLITTTLEDPGPDTEDITRAEAFDRMSGRASEPGEDPETQGHRAWFADAPQPERDEHLRADHPAQVVRVSPGDPPRTPSLVAHNLAHHPPFLSRGGPGTVTQTPVQSPDRDEYRARLRRAIERGVAMSIDIDDLRRALDGLLQALAAGPDNTSEFEDAVAAAEQVLDQTDPARAVAIPDPEGDPEPDEVAEAQAEVRYQDQADQDPR